MMDTEKGTGLTILQAWASFDCLSEEAATAIECL